MGLTTLWRRWLGRPGSGQEARRSLRRPRLLLSLEQLEDRVQPSVYTARSVAELVADINATNQVGGASTIMLAAGKRFTLKAVNNTTDGALGFPVIAANNDLTIVGNGDTIERSTASGTPAFRLFDVDVGATLRLENLTLQGGLAFGSGVAAQGGGICSKGTLTLKSVTVQNNTAQGSTGSTSINSLLRLPGATAAGGGIWSSGSLRISAGSIQNNLALGGNGANYSVAGGRGGAGALPPTAGGDGWGGGLYISGGTAGLTGVIVSANIARGGAGGAGADARDDSSNKAVWSAGQGSNGGSGFGGGLYVQGGTVDLGSTEDPSKVTLSGNVALGGMGGNGGSGTVGLPAGGNGGRGGDGLGGGLYAASGTTTLVTTTVTGNIANGGTGGNRGQGTPAGADGSAGVGKGGGLDIAAAVLLWLDDPRNVMGNHASTGDPDIAGSYSLLP